MRIKQCEYAEARISKFKHFLKKYELEEYHSPNEPAIFFGMYSRLTLNTLANHKSLAILIWRGSDIISKKQRLKSVLALKNPNIKHVAISDFIVKDLKRVGVKPCFLPLCATKIEDLGTCKLGHEIYAYVSKKRYNFYGGPIIDKLDKKCGYKINRALSTHTFTRKQLIRIYRKCFLGLRLTEHDGIANQVIEMGIMGRRCVHNGQQPNCLRWNNVDDVLESIDRESKRIGKVNRRVAQRTKNYIEVGEDWLNTSYWDK